MEGRNLWTDEESNPILWTIVEDIRAVGGWRETRLTLTLCWYCWFTVNHCPIGCVLAVEIIPPPSSEFIIYDWKNAFAIYRIRQLWQESYYCHLSNAAIMARSLLLPSIEYYRPGYGYLFIYLLHFSGAGSNKSQLYGSTTVVMANYGLHWKWRSLTPCQRHPNEPI